MSVVNFPKPSFKDPMCGLPHLKPIALIGRAKILELAAQPVEYVWQDIAVAGTTVLIAGPPGEGKTTLLFLVLGGRANTGEPISLLNREIQPAPAGQYLVVIEGEHSEASTARKLVKSLRLLGVADDALDRVIIVARKAVTLGSPEWADVTKLVAAGLVSDIAIDTVARVAPADANDEREQVKIYSEVAATIEKAPADSEPPIAWAVAHTRKNNTTGELADVAGSVQRTGQADTVMLIKGEKVGGRTVSTRVTFVKLREDPDDYPQPVAFAIAKNALGEPMLTTEDAATEDKRPLEAQILALLQVGPKTKNAIATALKRSGQDVEAALSNLFSAKAIRTGPPLKLRGREYKTFEVRPLTPDFTPDARSNGYAGRDAGPTPDEYESSINEAS